MNTLFAVLEKRGEKQDGINMVDLMMWLVIAALLLAAAIQGIGYYQKAAYLYQIQSDLDGAGTVATGVAANEDGVVTKVVAEKGLSEAQHSTGVVTTVELASDGKTPYLRGTHPGVDDKDVLYLFDACSDTYKIGVNVVPKGGTAELEDCGISATPPAGGGTGGTPTADDLDGDGIANASDPDIDGDGIANGSDPDIDGDGESNGSDTTPNGEPAPGGGGSTPGGTVPVVDYSFAGKVVGWGENNHGQLGNGTSSWDTGSYVVNRSDTPTLTILAGKTVTAFDASLTGACAVADEELFCWGSNSHGVIAGYPSGPDTQYGTPKKIAGFEGKTITQVAVANYNACAIADGRAYCWGSNYSGQLGNGTVDTDYDVEHHYGPTAVTGALTNADVSSIAVSSSNNQMCAISAGDVYCWGDNYWNGLGLGTATETNWGAEPLPVKIAGELVGKKATFITKGYYDQTCAIADGIPYCWGDNEYAYFPIASTDVVPTPTAWDMSSFPAGSVVTDISMGENHACAIVSGKAYCWSNLVQWYNLGQLGQGTNGVNGNTNPAPVVTAGTAMDGKPVTSIAAGQNSTCAAAGGDLFCWGGSQEGQRGLFTNEDSGVPALIEKGDVTGKSVIKAVDGWDTFFAIYN